MGRLICKDIEKSYKDKQVLSGVSLTIEQGKIYGLIGRNGAGKTTLLSIMTAQGVANSGTVFYDNMPVWENREALDHLCFSREINTLSTLGPNSMRVREYLELGATYYPNWDQKKAESLLEYYKLKKKDRISKLSKGMLSILTIIIGICSNADITILDEPVAGLDVVARKEFYKLVLEEAEKGRGFVISTHIIEEASDIFEDVIILHNGKILLEENTQDLLSRAVCVSGLADDVDPAVNGLQILKTENVGRKRIVTALVNAGDPFPAGTDISVQPVTLQNLFVAMCGEVQ